MEWSQILCCLVGFTKINTDLFLERHITTLTSIQALIIFFFKRYFFVRPTGAITLKHTSPITFADYKVFQSVDCISLSSSIQ